MRKRHQRGGLAKVNGRWIAQWREDGRRRKRTLGTVSGMTKTEAQQALEQILAPINQGVGSPSTSDKLAHFIEGVFLPFYRRKWKPSTAITTENRLRKHLLAMLAVIGGMRTGEILALQWRHVFTDRIEVVQRIYQRQIDTPKTRNSVRSVAH